jgi:hypothetical protein
MKLTFVRISPDASPAGAIFDLCDEAVQACADAAAMYERTGFHPPWTGYLAFSGSNCVGACSFNGPPAENAAEIRFQAFAGHEGQGAEEAMVRWMVDAAAQARPGVAAVALTPAEAKEDANTLKQLGFHRCGDQEGDNPAMLWRLETAPEAESQARPD